MFHNNYTQEEYRSYHVVLQGNPETGTGPLLLGDLNAATDQELMHEHNVRTIITAATGLQHLKISAEQTHVVFPLLDLKTQNIQAYFDLSNATIEENLKRGGVLVHCGAGISRSATLVIAYYMKKFKTTFAPAIKHVRSCRPNICPNLGFELQLKHYQDILSQSEKKKVTKQEPEKDNGKPKQFLETKQMLLTFNAPVQNKPSRMSMTNSKAFGTHTPNLSRKTPNYSSSKKTKVEGDFLVVGHQAELKKDWPWEGHIQGQRKGQRARGRDNHSFKL